MVVWENSGDLGSLGILWTCLFSGAGWGQVHGPNWTPACAGEQVV
jgi:hypothetical protein